MDYTSTNTVSEPWTSGANRLADTIMQIYQIKQMEKQKANETSLAKLSALLKTGEQLGYTPEIRSSMDEAGKGLGIKIPAMPTRRATPSMVSPTTTFGQPVPSAPFPAKPGPGETIKTTESTASPSGRTMADFVDTYLERGFSVPNAVAAAKEDMDFVEKQKKATEWRAEVGKLEGDVTEIMRKYRNRKGGKIDPWDMATINLYLTKLQMGNYLSPVVAPAASLLPGILGSGAPTPQPGGAGNNNDPLGIR